MPTDYNHIILPGDEVTAMSWQLFKSFDAGGEPVYEKGSTTRKDVLHMLDRMLKGLKPVAEPYPSVSLGKLVVETKDGREIEIKLVFLLAEERYSELAYVGGQQYFAGPSLPEIISNVNRDIPG